VAFTGVTLFQACTRLQRQGETQPSLYATNGGVAAGENYLGWARPVSRRLTARRAAKPREER
jgi:hypothetical protein